MSGPYRAARRPARFGEALEAAHVAAAAAEDWLTAASARLSEYPETLRLATLELLSETSPTC